MKKRLLGLCLIAVINLVSLTAFTQSILFDYDSVPISKPKVFRDRYHFNQSEIKEVTIVKGKPKAVTEMPKNFLVNFTGGVVTLLTGLNTISSTESIWMTENELAAKNDAYTWKVQLFFPGEYFKARDKAKNEDGSTSLVTVKGLVVDWGKGGYGVILENNDTIGKFTVSTNFQSNTENLDWLSRMETENRLIQSKLDKYKANLTYANFNFSGLFQGKNISICTSGNQFRSIILLDNKPIGIYQSDPIFTILGKKNRIEPFLLIDKHADSLKEIDMYRLSMLCRLLSHCINTDFYEM